MDFSNDSMEVEMESVSDLVEAVERDIYLLCGAHMGKRKKASDSIDTFLTLMRTLEIVIMNRADFCKRQMENLEGKLTQYHSEALELSSKCSPFLALIIQKFDGTSDDKEQFINKVIADLAGEEVLSEHAEFMKMAKEEVGDFINRVFRAPLLASSSNPSPDLCGDFFETFKVLEFGIDCLDRFDRFMDSWLRKISAYLSDLKLMASSHVNSPSTDPNNHETDGS